MKKKINENNTSSPYKKRKQKRTKKKKTGKPRNIQRDKNNFNTEHNLICKKLMCFSVTTKFSSLMI